MKDWLLTVLTPFLAGIVCAVNLLHLLPSNGSYDAQWWKVAVAVVAGLIGPVIYKGTK